jgi:hypothetical protein
MLSCVSSVLLPALFLSVFSQPVAQQSAGKPVALPPIPMPAARADASYAIYALLVPSGETAGPSWPQDLWLVSDTTVTLATPGRPCWAPTVNGQTPLLDTMNPHLAVQPAGEDRHDFDEILLDFDKRCHERVALHPWKSAKPLHMLNDAQQTEFERTRFPRDATTPDKYKGAAALYSFSEVYFNAHSTVAMVYVSTWCGNVCGQGWWSAFALREGHWKPLRWGSVSSTS